MPNYILNELFLNLAEFRDSAPNVESSATFQALNASAVSVRKMIRGIISEDIWNMIVAESDTDARLYLRSAWANRVMYGESIFIAVTNRQNKKTDTYKYELEAIKRQYIDNYYNAMDSLLAIISSTPSYGWETTWIAQQMKDLKIKTVLDFESYYHIDSSFLYFIRTVPIQKKELLLTFNSYYEKIADRTDLLPNLNTALVYTILARTLKQFDIIELPPTLRNYFDDNTLSRNGNTEREAISSLAADFLGDAQSLLSNIDIALTDTSIDVNVGTNLNEEENKYYGML